MFDDFFDDFLQDFDGGLFDEVEEGQRGVGRVQFRQFRTADVGFRASDAVVVVVIMIVVVVVVTVIVMVMVAARLSLIQIRIERGSDGRVDTKVHHHGGN